MKRASAIFVLAAIVVAGAFAQKVPTVTKPVTIQIWHSRGAGANGDMIAASVKEFNQSNPYGITVVETFQGNYATCLAKVMQGVAAGNNPALTVLDSAVASPYMAEEGMLVDLLPFMQRDKVDPNNFIDTFMIHSKFKGQVVTLPYARSGLVFYYNADMLKEAGLQPPKTIKEMEKVAKALTKVENGKTVRYGLLVHNETWIHQNWAYQLGSNYFSKDGKSSPFLEDGTMLKVLKEWKRWIDEGWCAAPAVTDEQNDERTRFYQGKIAMFLNSSGSLSGILKSSKFNVGVSLPPSFSDVQSTCAGGGNIAMLSPNTSPNEQAAAWEFIKFLMTEKQVATNAIKTGYLPVLKSSINDPDLKEYWKTVPQAKTCYENLRNFGQAVPWTTKYSELDQYVLQITSKLIKDGSVTPEQAYKEMQTEAKIVFGSK